MIQINLNLPVDYTDKHINNSVCERLGITSEQIIETKIIKLDINTIGSVYFKASIGITLDDKTENILCHRYSSVKAEMNGTAVKKVENTEYFVKHVNSKIRPIVVGSGPAGLFASLILAESGLKPILLERGYDVDKRIKAVNTFVGSGQLDENCNIQFGEGGAGTFSDGKLKPGKIDRYKLKVLSEFVQAGAPEEIMYYVNAHIGTDNLRLVVKNIRKKIVSCGGEVHFNTKVTDIFIKNNGVKGVRAETDGEEKEFYSDNIIFATGHSSRDIFNMLYKHGVKMEQKSFGAGVRAEHLQSEINKMKFGEAAGKGRLGAASYKLVTHLANGRNVYSFCMCPGGTVVAAASEDGGIVTNGMSEFKRDGENANAALLVTVFKEDFKSEHPLAGIEYQRKIEKAAFVAGGGEYKAPIQRMEDFINKKQSCAFGCIKPTYARGTSFAKADDYLPEYITDSLRAAFVEFEEWMPGFYMPDALITGAETRSTSPVRILRNDKLESVSISGLYPCGEGAGYAGGIISAAVDGIKCAEMIINR